MSNWGKGALVLAGLVLGVLAWIGFDAPTAELLAPAAPPVAPAAAQTVPPPMPAAPAAVDPAASAVAATPASTCPHQALRIGVQGRTLFGCVGATQQTQTGSIRSFVVEPEGISRWKLRVDVAGDQVVSALLVGAAGPPPEAPASYACSGDCAGFLYLGPDASGAWQLQARAVRLHAAEARPDAGAGSTVAAATAVQLDATLRAPAESAAGGGCAMPSVTLVEDGKAVNEFCPAAGAGFEVRPAGHIAYRFLDLNGRVLTIEVETDGSVRRAELGPYACDTTQCGGLSMHVLGSTDSVGSERRFDFSGVTLSAAPGRRASLTGSVLMPAQE